MKIPEDTSNTFAIQNIGEAKMLYREICNGYSSIYMGEHADREYIYMKHFSELDNTRFLEIIDKYETIAKNRGLLTEEEKIKNLHEAGAWSEREEFERNELLEAIAYARGQKSKLVLKSQQDACEKDIEEKEKLLVKQSEVRTELLDLTVESWSSKKMMKYYVYYSFFEDQQLTKPLFTEDVYDDYEEEDLYEYIMMYNYQHKWFTDLNYKKVAVWPFFLNSFFLIHEDISKFFDVPIIKLTVQQSEILSSGRWIKGILSQCGKNPPSDLYAKLDELIKWYNIEQARIQSKQNKEARGSSRGDNKTRRRIG